MDLKRTIISLMTMLLACVASVAQADEGIEIYAFTEYNELDESVKVC